MRRTPVLALLLASACDAPDGRTDPLLPPTDDGAGGKGDEIGELCEASGTHHDVTFAVVALDPPSPAGTPVSQGIFGLDAEAIEARVVEETVEGFAAFSDGAIEYHRVDGPTIRLTDYPPRTDGDPYDAAHYETCISDDAKPCEPEKANVDELEWIVDNGLCDLDVDEIWLFTSPFLLSSENILVGPPGGGALPFDGMGVNGARFEHADCPRPIMLHTITYVQPDNYFHTFSHRIEQTMNFITDPWSDDDRTRHWWQPAGMGLYSGTYPSDPFCGNAHWASNTALDRTTPYSDPDVAPSTCADWAAFPDETGAAMDIDCSAWGCNAVSWYHHFLGSLPHSSGCATLTTRSGAEFSMPKDWWSLLLYPNEMVAFRRYVDNL